MAEAGSTGEVPPDGSAPPDGPVTYAYAQPAMASAAHPAPASPPPADEG